MNIWNIVVVVVLAAAVGLAIRAMRNGKAGGCSCNCAGCTANCGKRKE